MPTIKEGKAKPTHVIQCELISRYSYKYTQEDIPFMVYAECNSIPKNSAKLREKFFEKEHPCLRSSALPKKYGWGIHFDGNGKPALYSRNSSEYSGYEKGKVKNVKLVKRMRSKRA